MDTTTCIANNIWETYANKTIGKAHLIYITEHVKTCELCADIKEGIDAMPNSVLLVEKVDTVNKAVDVLIKEKSKKKSLVFYWSAAAILFISFGLVWYNSQNLNKEFAQNETKQATIPPAVFEQMDSTDFLADKTNKQDKVLTDNFNFKNVPSVKLDKQNNTIEEATQISIDDDVKESMGEVAQAEEMDISQPKPAVAEQKVLIDADEPAPKVYNVETVKATAKQKRSVSSIPEAISNQMLNNNVDLNRNKFQDSIILEKAESYFNKNQYDSSLAVLNTITYLNEEAQFLKAQNLVKTKKIAEAKLLLEALIKFKGKKAKEAKKLLKSLGSN